VIIQERKYLPGLGNEELHGQSYELLMPKNQ
jgi:hypothetical protein